MKKIYALIVVCLGLVSAGSAQTTYTWAGGTSGDWRTASNWTSAPSTPDYPHLAGDNVIFNVAANVSLDAVIDVNTLTVTNNAVVKITSQVDLDTITVHSTDAGAPGLRIDAGASLELDGDPGTGMDIAFVPNGQASISGTWILSGDADNNVLADYYLPESGSATRVNFNSGGKLLVTPKGFLPPSDDSDPDNYLVFKSGSTLEIQSPYAFIIKADYDANSTIIFNGLVDIGPAVEEKNSIGNLIYNCPGQTDDFGLALVDFEIKGNLEIQGTNGKALTILSEALGSSGIQSNAVTIDGNLSITGNSVVYESKVDGSDKAMTLTVGGNFILQAPFNMQDYSANDIQPTNLVLKGDFVQSGGGQFLVPSTAVNESANIFNVEFNGTNAQNITSNTGTINNNANQVTLKINNSQGVTLNSPLEVGRIDFSGSTPGKINTTATNVLTIANTSENALVVNSPSNSAYVNGPVARKTVSTNPVSFPTGLSGTLRPLLLTPSSSTANTFVVNLVSGSNGVTPISPIAGLADYYWSVSQLSGSASAVIQMDLQGAIAGASATDTLIPVKFDGTNWLDARESTGTKIFPGTSTSGSLITGSQSDFKAFTIGYAINSALPIKLLSFTGKKVQNTAELAWEITENSTPAKFEIVKSIDGISFTSVGTLPGMEGKLKYSLTDNSLAAGNNFYRLKMYDKDGSISYSNIIVIMNGSKGIVISSMMPTIVRDRARLSVTSSVRGNMQLVVTDISGRIVQNQVVSIDAGNQDVWLNASSLSAGMFQVTGYINGEKTATFRFIKQ